MRRRGLALVDASAVAPHPVSVGVYGRGLDGRIDDPTRLEGNHLDPAARARRSHGDGQERSREGLNSR